MNKLNLLVVFLLLVTGTLFADAFPRAERDRPPYAPNRVKVKLTGEAYGLARLPQGLYAETNRFGINDLDQVFTRYKGTRIIRAHRRLNNRDWEARKGFDRWFLIELEGRPDIWSVIASFRESRYIEEAHPEYMAYRAAVPNDTYYANNWGHNNTAQLPVYISGYGHAGSGVGTVGFDSDAQAAWDRAQGYGSDDIIIAIIDSGVDTSHPDLRLVTGYDYGDNDSNPMDDSADPGHGTSCSGVAAAIANNSLGVAGIAGGCSVMPLKVADSNGDMYFTPIDDALTHAADNGAHVISMSLGIEGGYGEGDIPSTDDALEYAYDAGVVIFAATANANASAIAYPANHTDVISVGAASPCGQRKSTSSCDGETWWGSNYGVNTQDDKEAVDIMGPTILPATDLVGTSGYNTSSSPAGDYYMWFNGTSCATPYVAGVAALMLSNDDTLTPAEVRSIMMSTATDMTYDGGSGWDRYTGYGLVNANDALAEIEGGIENPSNFTATSVSTSRIDLSWAKNTANDNVMVAWSSTGIFGVPVDGTSYSVGNTVSGGGTVIYNGSGTTYSHTSLDEYTLYYYKAWSVGDDGSRAVAYSTGVTTNETTQSSDIIIGNGTTDSYLPIYPWYGYTYSQSIYLQPEIAKSGDIEKIYYYWNGAGEATASNSWVVYMGHTTKTAFSSSTDWIASSGLTQVFSGTVDLPATEGWIEIALSTSFSYNNSDNLVIAVDENESNYDGYEEYFYSTTSSAYRSIRFYSDTTNPNPASPPTSGNYLARVQAYPNVRLDFEDGFVPVELSSFTATATVQNYVMIQWTAQTETNVSGYYIYRNDTNELASAERINAFISAANSSQETNYAFTDREVMPGYNYYYWLQNLDLDGETEFHGPVSIIVADTQDELPIIPLQTGVQSIYPNPFSARVSVNFGLAKAAEVELAVLNLKGQVVRRLLSGQQKAGSYKLTWDGLDESGAVVSSGVYILNLKADRYAAARKLIMVK